MGELRTAIRVRAEGLAVILKTTVTFLVLYFDPSRDGTRALIAFALGQLAYAMTLLAVYLLHYGVNHLRLERGPAPKYVQRSMAACAALTERVDAQHPDGPPTLTKPISTFL